MIPTLCCSLIFGIILGAYFGVYTWNNPDVYSSAASSTKENYCWSSETLAGEQIYSNSNKGPTANYFIQTIPSNSYETVPEEFDVNVTQNFLTWFTWGFILQMVAIVGAFVTAAGHKIKILKVVGGGIIGFVQVVGNLAWIIVGSVFRFRDTGMVCSGYGNLNYGYYPTFPGTYGPGLTIESG